MLEQIKQGKQRIQVQADDTDIFILLLYWFWKSKPNCQITMKQSDGCTININETANTLGNKCLQLLAVHSLSGCDTTSYPYGKGKATALKVLLNEHCSGLEVFGKTNATQAQLLHTGRQFFTCLYSVKQCPSMNALRYQMFTKKQNRAPELK
jgi:hypothetical protein